MLSFSDPVDKLIAVGEISTGKSRYAVIKMSVQTVAVRVRWLPVYYGNSILWEVFSGFVCRHA